MTAIDGHDDTQSNRCFRRCYRDDKDYKYLSGQYRRYGKVGEGYHGDIDSVKHNLDAHQDDNGISLGQGAI